MQINDSSDPLWWHFYVLSISIVTVIFHEKYTSVFSFFSAKLKQYYEELVRQLEISRNSSISEVEFQEAVRKLEERHNKVLEKRKFLPLTYFQDTQDKAPRRGAMH